MTGAPSALKVASCRSMRSFSRATEPSSRRPENQPETSFSPCASRSGPSVAASIGNLPPVSVPLKPAARLSFRQVSSGVSPPSSGRSSLDQAIGATPRFIVMGVLSWLHSGALLLPLVLGVLGRRFAHARPRADLGNPDVPPGVARRPLGGADLDLDDVSAVGRLGALEGLLQLDDRRHALGQRAQRPRVAGEVHADLPHATAMLEEVVEGRAAFEVLQPV